MQCILTRKDQELYYGVGLNSLDLIEHSSFTCPYCGRVGFSETSLCDHIGLQHHFNQSSSSATSTHTHTHDSLF